MRTNCPQCGKLIVESFGDRSSKVIVISDVPSFEDVRNGMAYSGSQGEALKQEMGLAGIQAHSCHMMTLWKHGQDKECDISWHVDKTLPTLLEASLILMLGSECVQIFTGCSNGDVSGTIVPAMILKKKTKIVAGPSILTIGKSPIGELRLALNLFAEQRRKLK